jgi:hypothetical protein
VLANKRDGKRGWCPWARKLIGAVVVWVAACGSGWAQDGNELLKRCLEPVGESWSLYCAGYLRGVSDALMLSDICVHEGVGYDYIKVVVVRYLLRLRHKFQKPSNGAAFEGVGNRLFLPENTAFAGPPFGL